MSPTASKNGALLRGGRLRRNVGALCRNSGGGVGGCCVLGVHFRLISFCGNHRVQDIHHSDRPAKQGNSERNRPWRRGDDGSFSLKLLQFGSGASHGKKSKTAPVAASSRADRPVPCLGNTAQTTADCLPILILNAREERVPLTLISPNAVSGPGSDNSSKAGLGPLRW
jgi:hypothetical protein